MHILLTNISLLIILTLLCGLLGGYGGFLLERLRIVSSEELQTKRVLFKLYLRASIILGVIASFTVPLFLEIVTIGANSDNLLDAMLDSGNLDSAKNNVEAWFIYAGFCLIAAVSGQSFIKKLSDRLIKQVDSLREELNEEQNHRREQQASINGLREELAEAQLESPEIQNLVSGLDESALSLLKDINTGGLKPTSISVLADAVGTSTSGMSARIEKLIDADLVSTVQLDGETYLHTKAAGIAAVKLL